VATALISDSFGLIGVIVGGVLNQRLAERLERTREQRAARVAARLLQEDLTLVSARANASLEADVYGPEVDRNALQLEHWSEAKGLLGAVLKDEDWQQLASANTSLARLEAVGAHQRERFDVTEAKVAPRLRDRHQPVVGAPSH
jgi:hypothetical protein